MSQQVPLPRLAEQHSLYIIGKDKRNDKAKGNYGRYCRGVNMFKIHCIKFLNNLLFLVLDFNIIKFTHRDQVSFILEMKGWFII